MICEKNKCTGCAACYSVCPKECIKMIADADGFLRPNIDEERCVKCNKCRRICPINNAHKSDELEPIGAYAVRSKDQDIVLKSSSGGLFSVLGLWILGKGGVVVGAGFDDRHQVVHKICTDAEKLDELRRSKYVQSKIGDIYKTTQGLLEEGRELLFCGTPCQIAGLKAFLGKEYSGIYTMDFICHGIPSPKAYNKYLDFQTKNGEQEIKSINFRSKKRGWHTHSLSIIFNDGHEYNESCSVDYYMHSFIMDMTLRPSCYHCQFRGANRISDITVADFWGVEQVIPDWNDDSGVSLAFVHTEKGLQLLQMNSDAIDKQEVELHEAIRYNPALLTSPRVPPARSAFLRDMNIMRYDALHEKYCSTKLLSKIRRKLGNSFL